MFGKLRGLIKEKGLSESMVAEKAHISKSRLSLLLNGKSEWRAPEIKRVADILDVPDSEIVPYFLPSRFGNTNL